MTGLVTTRMLDQPRDKAAVVELRPRPVRGRFVTSAVATETTPEPAISTKSAEAKRPAGNVNAVVPLGLE